MPLSPIVRNPSLDVLRAVAVILVFCYHSEGALLVSRFGWVGVDLFFVLSGFLVSGLLFREYRTTQRVQPGRFLLRRGFKIYPQFYFLIAVTILGTFFFGGPPWRPVTAEVLFFQNYTRGLWTHTWSLAIEEHFYLLLTAAIAIAAGRGGENPFRALPKWIAAAAAGVLALRVALYALNPPITEFGNVFPSHLRMDSFLGGVLVAYLQAFQPEVLAAWMRRFGTWLPPASILLLAPVSFLRREDAFMVTVGFTMISWAFVLLLLSVLYPAKPSTSGRGARALAKLGEVSYGFYLWHAPVLLASEWARGLLAARGVSVSLAVNLPVTFALSLGLAFLTTRLLEAPMLRLRDRMFPSLTKTPPEPAPAGWLSVPVPR